MSASTEKKIRRSEIDAGTHRKSLAQQKEEKKQRKERIKWIVVCSIIAVFFIFVLLLETGVIYRNTDGLTVSYDANESLGIKAGERSFTVAECNYMYNTQYVNILNTYGEYISYVGLDTTKPLSEQTCNIAETEEPITWDEYFMNATETSLRELSVLAAYAEANGIELTDEDKANIDENIKSFDDAKQYGYGSANKFLAANYGKGVNVSVARDVMELQTLAFRVQRTIADSQEYTAEELSTKYDAVKDQYDKFDYSYYYVEAEKVAPEVKEGEENASTEPVPNDETIAAALSKAEGFKAAIEEGKSISEAVTAEIKDAKVTEQKAVSGTQVEQSIKEWLVAADRKAGDVAAIKDLSGAYVVVYGSRDNGQHKTDESGDLNYCDYVAKSLLSDEYVHHWLEENTSPVAKAAKVDTAFGIRYVGR